MRRHVGLCNALGLRALLEGLLADDIAAHQALGACQVGLGVGQVGFRLRQAGAGLIERVLERPAVDGEEQLAFLDHLAVLEVDAVEIARNAGPHLDGIDGHEPADILVLVDDCLGNRPCNCDLRGRRRRL